MLHHDNAVTLMTSVFSHIQIQHSKLTS